MSYFSSSRRSTAPYSSRPTSLYGSGSTSLSLLGHSPVTQSSPYLNGGTSYTSYGGMSSGYGSLHVPSTSSSSALSAPSLYSSLLQTLGSTRSGSHSPRSGRASPASYSPSSYSPSSSRYPSRSSSFNRHTSYKPTLSRYSSSASLATSEGYESGTEKSGRSSRLDSTSTPTDDDEHPVAPALQENGEIDYKKLYEESQLENERLREKLRRTEDDLENSKSLAEKNALLHKNSLSEVEKRERRAMERKLSEMEEELKQLQKLKADNERLRAENRALTRVITNLTSSHPK